MRGRRIVLGLFLVMGLLLSAGCGSDGGSRPKPNPYLDQTTPDNVLNNFQVAWQTRDSGEYARLLADDFRFYFDNETRQDRNLPVYWERATDSTQVGKLFASTMVSDISIDLKWPANTTHPATEAGRERWVYYDILDVFLDVDLAPTTENPDGVTYRVEDQQQRFYFRKGKTEGDTLSTSATAGLYYIVEWVDYGSQSSPGGLTPAAGQNATWSGIKAAF